MILRKNDSNSCAKKNDLFGTTFKDSKIAQSFTCGSAKCPYIINFGLALYFKDILNQTLSEAPYVTCFDESHNDILKKGQMDL